MKILLVDDDEYVGKKLGEHLKYFDDHRLVAVTSVSAALSTLESDPDIACVILDIALNPEHPISEEDSGNGVRTGLALGKLLKQRYPKLPVIGITGYPDEFVERWFRSHGDGFFKKPLDPQVLGRHIRTIFGNKPPLRTFIVHGHDGFTKLEVKNYLQSTLGLPEPIILHEVPSRGRTIIEKLEQESQGVDVVFVLLTPDDKFFNGNGAQIERARQNVILELGFFLGKFGRKDGKVILLYKGFLDIPSDLSGLIYINIEAGIAASGEEIRRELRDFL